MLEGCDSGQQFSTGRAVISLSLGHDPRKDRHWPFHPVDHLGQHGPNCDVGCVRVKYARLVGVRKGQGSGFLQGPFQPIKSFLGCIRPLKLGILSSQFGEGLRYVGKVFDETPVIRG